jgi:hypothetical protein
MRRERLPHLRSARRRATAIKQHPRSRTRLIAAKPEGVAASDRALWLLNRGPHSRRFPSPTPTPGWDYSFARWRSRRKLTSVDTSTYRGRSRSAPSQRMETLPVACLPSTRIRWRRNTGSARPGHEDKSGEAMVCRKGLPTNWSTRHRRSPVRRRYRWCWLFHRCRSTQCCCSMIHHPARNQLRPDRRQPPHRLRSTLVDHRTGRPQSGHHTPRRTREARPEAPCRSSSRSRPP